MRAQRNLGEYKAHQHMHSGNMRDKEKEEKKNCRNNGWRHLKFIDEQYPVHLGCSMKSKYDHSRETHRIFINNCIIVEVLRVKDKGRSLESSKKEKWFITFQEIPVRWTEDISVETVDARKQWDEILTLLVMSREGPVNQVSYTPQSHLSEMKAK